MMYGLSIYNDRSIELFDISDTMLESIVKDARLANEKSTVLQTEKYVWIIRNNLKTTYFYNKEDRKKNVLGLL